GRWEARRVLSSRPFCPCDGRRVSPRYLSAAARYTTQRFGSALNLHLHFHILFLEGVYLDRTTVGLQPRFLAGAPPTDTDIAAVIQKISRRVIRTLRHLGYLETGLEPPVATGYDPLRDTAPELARTMVASVQHRIACGERAGQHVRRIGSGFGAEGEAPRL